MTKPASDREPDGAGAQPLRFLTLEDVAEELATSQAQVYALVRRGDLRALKLGGRRQWQVGRDDLEAYIEAAYAETAKFVAETHFMESKPPSKRDRPEEPAEG